MQGAFLWLIVAMNRSEMLAVFWSNSSVDGIYLYAFYYEQE